MRKTPWFTGEGATFGEGWDARFGDFLVDLFMQEGLAETSLLTLQSQLHGFNRWLLEICGTTWDKASVADLHCFFLQIQDSLDMASLRSKQWAVTRLYRWARQEKLVSMSTAKALLPTRAAHRHLGNIPTHTEVVQLLQQPDTATPEGLRDRAILELLYSTGLRAAELLDLEVDQTLHGACLRVMGKGKKERLVVMGEHAQFWIAQYNFVRKSLLRSGGHALTSTERLFVSGGKHPEYQYQQLRRMVARHARSCGLQLTPHKLRHAFATHMYQGNAPLRSIQLLLGHERLETTTIYVSRYHSDDKALLRQHHPREIDYRKFVRWANH